MSSEDQKPSKRVAPVMNNMTGRVKHDERGNAVWEWAVRTGSVAASSAKGRGKLDTSALSIADDPPPAAARELVKSNPEGTRKGYSPYDSGLLAKGEAPRKKDLRKLSEWLRLKKQADRNKAEND